MKPRTATSAAIVTLLVGIGLVAAIGFAVDEIRISAADVAHTAQINDGAAEIARGPARIAPIDGSTAPAAAAIVTE